MKNEVLTKGAELEAAKARIHDLEQVVGKKDLNIVELKRLMQRIKVCPTKSPSELISPNWQPMFSFFPPIKIKTAGEYWRALCETLFSHKCSIIRIEIMSWKPFLFIIIFFLKFKEYRRV